MADLSNKRVCVVVLGDIGHSPRMQYHVRSLLQHGCDVDLIGYVETKPHTNLLAYEKLRIHQLTPVPELGLPNFIRLVTKTIWQFLTLFVALISIRTPEFLLCQNPPAIPTLLCCYYICSLRKAKLIIDWHNYTHTILSLSGNGEGRLSKGTVYLVKVAKWVEGYYGKRAFGNLCVTRAMREDLLQNWGVRATILYDRPPEQFHPISMTQKHNLFMKLSKTYSAFLPRNLDDFKASGVQESTCFTQKLNNGTVVAKPNRPGLLISSTSWTPDEDFEILMYALDLYEAEVLKGEAKQLPDLFCVITGKGPMKKDYEKRISERNWKHIQVVMPWLEAEDYPQILAAADIGVCLHYSSSGLDLPMKVVDMFGCGLPVCAINFTCINELVIHQKNGFVFENKKELYEYLSYWFERFPNNTSLDNIKREFQRKLTDFQNLRWDENWNQNALPLFA